MRPSETAILLPLPQLRLLGRYMPGVVLTCIVATATVGLHGVGAALSLSPAILAILLGMAAASAIGANPRGQAGIGFCAKTLLRFAVMLLGARITVQDMTAFGGAGLVAIIVVVAATLGVTLLIGRALSLDRDVTALVGAGTAICGASAVAGVNSAVRGSDEKVAYAIGLVTLFGTIGIFAYPLIGNAVGLTDVQYGIWTGLSLHEVAQVVAAGFAGGETAGETAVTMKLGRVLMLAVVIAVFARYWHRGMAGGADRDSTPTAPPAFPVPWFLAGFLVLSALHSLGLLPEMLREIMAQAAQVLMLLAMAAIGLGTRLGELARLGIRPVILGALATVFISLLALGFALWIG